MPALQKTFRIYHVNSPFRKCADPYDGRTRTFVVTLPTAFVLAACGLPATLHSAKSLPPKWGITLMDILQALKVPAAEGSEDLAVDKRTRTYVIRNGVSELFIVDPEMFELLVEVPAVEWTAELQAQTILSVLRGEAELPYLNAVLLNSAVRLWIGEKAGSIEEGIYLARHAIEQGHALKKYQEWTEALETVTTA
jgi:anthranilate phosphoribosyltransferase